ncbi:hypothetical protein KIN20_020911 [Parelaphostrongylus tenuis]|uniref:Uncharacterized protein n=1 Tax=Parelaphostrongylus tenuis TaxID=148309 RepID=A0AAD5NAB6_PARTN|nr:hypothetical protein KIN20_020911 [Parelaphostrongylus tenuis]
MWSDATRSREEQRLYGYRLQITCLDGGLLGSGSIPIEVPGIATSKAAAKGFIDRLVMQTVFDVLEQQGRSAFLPDTIISAILGQLRIQINYDPLECKAATEIKNAQTMIMRMNMVAPHCIIVSGTVTALCGTIDTNNEVDCMMPTTLKDTAAIPVNYTTFSGTFTTTNIVMANWPREMWQGVVNRAVRMLASSPFATHFVLGICNCQLKRALNYELSGINHT